MRAVRYSAYGEVPELVDLPEPGCDPAGVVVRVEATGVCRSDWHAWRGHDPVPLPMVPGHEWAGTLHEVGSEVRGWAVGDRVTAPFVLGCGLCEHCRAGHQQVCPTQQQPGFTYDGSWAELVAVPSASANLVRLPDDVSWTAAAVLGCRFATAYRAVTTLGEVGEGDWVAVHGCGGVGLSAVMVAAALGAVVVAVDPSPEARRLAADLGARVVVDPGEADVATHLRDLTAGGVSVSLECTGQPAVATASVASLRPRGRHVQVGLLLGDASRGAIPMDLVVARELQVLGSHGMPAGDYPGMLELLSHGRNGHGRNGQGRNGQGRIDPGRLVTRRADLAEGPAALAAMDDQSGSFGITVLRVRSD